MSSKTRDFLIPTLLLFLVTVLIGITGGDLKLSSLFYINGAWPIGDQQPWHGLYLLDRIPSIGMGICGLAAAIAGGIYQQRRHWVKPGLFLVLLLVIGPGLTVNALFKEYWGRPRPREVMQLGGTKEFLHPWQRRIAHKGRSFPSGHSSAAFYLSAPFFVLRRRKPQAARLWLWGGIVFGLLMSIARITQGGHFLTDTIWAWGIVHLLAVSLCYLMGLDRSTPLPQKD